MKLIACITALLICGAAAAAGSGDEPFYDGLGGKDGVQQIVASLMVLVKNDVRISDTFRDSDMQQIARHLREQLCQLSGGPCIYKGKEMADIHEGLHISSAQFNALAEDLQLAMEQHNVPPRIQNKLIAKLAPMHGDIVGK
jgi:hemoglobin